MALSPFTGKKYWLIIAFLLFFFLCQTELSAYNVGIMEYVSVSDVLKKAFGRKVYRLSLQSGCTCPNRDGTLSYGGCSFCSEGGSGDFSPPLLPIDQQIELARAKVDPKIPASIPPQERLYIAYFQSYTNTYGPVERLQALYQQTIRRPDICLLSLGTRPDCLGPDMINMLKELARIKPVWVELGLQTADDKIAQSFNRGYPTKVYEEAYLRLKEAGLTVITHLILGLPGQDKEDMLASADYVASLYRPYMPAPGKSDIRTDGVKLQLLHVLKGTLMGRQYLEKPFPVLTLDEYTDLVVSCLKALPSQTVIHRITGDGPKKLLIAPLWSGDKKRVLNTLNKAIREAER